MHQLDDRADFAKLHTFCQENSMVLIITILESTTWLPSMTPGYSLDWQLFSPVLSEGVLAQALKDPDILGNIQTAFNNFVQSGQIWALLIGLFIGYLLRGLTTYG